jgi:hypothetical protein
MIQFNTTSPLTTNDNLPGSIVNLGDQSSGSSFDSALSAALNATLEQFGINPNQVTLSIGSAATPTTSAATTAAAVSGNPMADAPATSSPATSPATTSPSTPATSGDSSTESAQQSFDDAYWANQPPAVQALRGMTDEGQREQLANELQKQGYSIDVPVMVWGWDPSITTAMRQSYGYTWIPALGQSPIQMAPGLSGFGGLTAYNPNDPPPGSIIVPPASS